MVLVRSIVLLALLSVAAEAQRRAPPRPSVVPRGQPFELVACSLGCIPTPDGYACTQLEIHVNEEVRLTFNRPVAVASVSVNTFRLVDGVTGQHPPGNFRIDPAHPSTLVYRPQMTFDSAGNPIFGLIDGRTYLLHVPGFEQDPFGPYLTDLDGNPNRTRLQCALVASAGVADVVPGRPFAKLSVRAVLERDPVTGDPVRIGTVPAQGATDVLRASPIELVCGDLMNPATLANPVTGRSSTLRVFFDPDGDVTGAGDWVSVPGTFFIALVPQPPATRVLFQADGGLPASGTQRPPGRVVFVIAPQVQDLAGNALLNPGVTSFTTESH